MLTPTARARPTGRRALGDEDEARALVTAAERVMVRKGVAATTVMDILGEAGLSTRAFYRHFKSKDDLLLAIYERNATDVAAALRARTEAAGTPRQRLVAWVDEVLGLAYDARRRRRTMVLAGEGVRFASQHPAEVAHIVQAMVAPLRQVLADGVEAGEFPLAEPATDAMLIFSLATTLARARLDRHTKLDRDAARAHVLRFALAGIGADGDS